jgi:LCP family protein required for cell wall assembly
LGYLAVALVLVAGSGVAAFITLSDDKSLAEKTGGGAPGILEMLADVSDEPQNVLVVGVDERPEVEGSRTDTTMLVRVYPKTGEVKIASIPRDLLVEIKPGVEDKINAAYSYDGISGTIGAVENFSNVYIDHYAIVDFAGFESMVDAVGGLKVDVEEGQVPPTWEVKDDAQHLNGRRALIYARYRNTEAGDLDRIKRQREVLAALRSKALRWRSVERFPQITRAVAENVETDMSIVEIASLGRAMSKHGRNGLMTSTQLEGTPETLENGSKVLAPDDAANEHVLREFRN